MFEKSRYTFEFHVHNNRKEVAFTVTYRTKPVTAKRASELFREERAKHDELKDKYVFSIKRNGDYVSLGSLR